VLHVDDNLMAREHLINAGYSTESMVLYDVVPPFTIGNSLTKSMAHPLYILIMSRCAATCSQVFA
jgi:hypothetical protein